VGVEEHEQLETVYGIEEVRWLEGVDMPVDKNDLFDFVLWVVFQGEEGDNAFYCVWEKGGWLFRGGEAGEIYAHFFAVG
jgi:hypothetical protein